MGVGVGVCVVQTLNVGIEYNAKFMESFYNILGNSVWSVVKRKLAASNLISAPVNYRYTHTYSQLYAVLYTAL